MGKAKIVVLLHETDELFGSLHYFIKLLMKEWALMGFAVEVIRGIERVVNADILVPHVDLTVIPDDYLAYYRHYPIVLNRGLIDISKTKVSKALVLPGDGYNGAVIVKTNRNSGGTSERHFYHGPIRHLPNRWGLRNKVIRATTLIEKRLKGWRHLETLHEYPIFPAVDRVPPGVFENPHLIVEKFQPERDGEFYCLRIGMLTGDQSSHSLCRSHAMCVKAANIIRHEEVPVPGGWADLRRTFNLDFGKADYVLCNGKIVLYDVNRTPTIRGPAPTPRAVKMAAKLAGGLESLLKH